MIEEANGRYHALDHLRSGMMLLGVALHSAMSYSTRWFADVRYVDRETSAALDVLIFTVHLFRMPLFFAVSGFLGALLYARRGTRAMVRNRAKRLLLPMVVAWALLFPLVGLGFLFARGGGDRAALGDAWAFMTSGAPVRFADFSLMHLWFLYYLLLFYALTLAALAVLRRRAPAQKRAAGRAFAAVASKPWGPLVPSVVTALTLLPMRRIGLDNVIGLVPQGRMVVAYGVFFAFGWLLYRHRDTLAALRGSWRRPLALGGVFTLLHLYLVLGRPPVSPGALHVTGAVVTALAIWHLIYGLLGAGLRYFARPSPLGRYLSDASYWIYLIHLPLTIWLPGLLVRAPLSALGKFAVVLGITTLVSLLSYHFLVRSTFVGAVLNGRRYPRGLPESR